MLQRAEQLKLMLCHRQAHYLTLIARGLLQLHHLELAEFEGPAAAAAAAGAASHSSALPPDSPSSELTHHQPQQPWQSYSLQPGQGGLSRDRGTKQKQAQQQEAQEQKGPSGALHEKSSSLSALDLAEELDDFFLPVRA